MSVPERSRWLLLVLSLCLALGGGLGVAFYVIIDNERSGQRDLCDFVGAIYPTAPGAPRPSSSLGQAQRAAAEHYQQQRC